MKNNKYRWRTFEEEKPKDGQFILVHDLFEDNYKCIFSAQYLGTKNEHVVVLKHIPRRVDRAPEHYPAHTILWREMCKLPGEK